MDINGRLSAGLLGLALLQGCSTETRESILREVADRMNGDYDEHPAIVVGVHNFVGDDRYFLRLWLEDNRCIVVETKVTGLIEEGGKIKNRNITYKLAHDAIKEWPFAVFDLNRECLPATSPDLVVVSG